MTWKPVTSEGPSPFYYEGEPADILEMLFKDDETRPSGFHLRVGTRIVEVLLDDQGGFPGLAYDDGKEAVN